MILTETITFPHLIYSNNDIQGIFMDLRQEDLVNRLIIHSSASTADVLCNMNDWDTYTIPIQALKDGIKHKQLDTVAFYLRSKENMFSIEKKLTDLRSVDETRAICGLSLLENAVIEHIDNLQTRQFGESLLKLCLEHLYKMNKNAVNSLKMLKQIEEPTDLLESKIIICLDSLMNFIIKFRNLLTKDIKFSRHYSMQVLGDCPLNTKQITLLNEWSMLSKEQTILQGLKIQDVGFLQLYLDKICNDTDPHKSIVELGLNEVYNNLCQRKLDDACSLLLTLGFDWIKEIRKICKFTPDKKLRRYLTNVLTEKDLFDEVQSDLINYIYKLEDLYPCPSLSISKQHLQNSAKNSSSHLRLSLITKYESIAEKINVNCSDISKQTTSNVISGNYSNTLIDWVENWTEETRLFVLLDVILRKNDTPFQSNQITKAAWKYFVLYSKETELKLWIDNYFFKRNTVNRWPFNTQIFPDALSDLKLGTLSLREEILNYLYRGGIFAREEEDKNEGTGLKFLQRLSKSQETLMNLGTLNIPFDFGALTIDEAYRYFVKYCIDLDLPDLFYKFLCINQSDKFTEILEEFNINWIKLALNMLHNTDKQLYNIASANQLYLNQEIKTWKAMIENNKIDRGVCLLSLSDEDFTYIDGRDETNYNWYQRFLNNEKSFHSKHITLNDAIKTKYSSLDEIGLSKDEDFKKGPHFSQEIYAKRFGVVFNLNYVHYLKHSRPCFAFFNFLQSSNIKDGDSINKRLLKETYRTTCRIALQNFTKLDISASCVAFLEMLDLESFSLRLHLQIAKVIYDYRRAILNCTIEEKRPLELKLQQNITSSLLKCMEKQNADLSNILEDFEEAAVNTLNNDSLDPSDSKTFRHWNLISLFCKSYSVEVSNKFLLNASRNNNWLSFILYSHLYQYPSRELYEYLKFFTNKALQEHLHYVITTAENVQKASLTGDSTPKVTRKTKQKIFGDDETDESRIEITPKKVAKMLSEVESEDLLGLVLACERHQDTFKMLSNIAIEYKNPVLACIASCYENVELLTAMTSYLLSQSESKSLDLNNQLSIEKFSDFSLTLIHDGYLTIALAIIHFLTFCKQCSSGCYLEESIEHLQRYKSALDIPRSEVHTNCSVFDQEWTINFASNVSGRLADILPLASSIDVMRIFNKYEIFPKDCNIENIIESLILCQEYKMKVLPSKLLEKDKRETEEITEKFLKINEYENAKTFASLNSLSLDSICLKKIRYEKIKSRNLENRQNSSVIRRFWFWANDLLTTNRCSIEKAIQFYQEELLESVTAEEELLLTKFLLNWLSLDEKSKDIITSFTKKYWQCKIELLKKTGQICKIDEETKLFRKIVEFLPQNLNLKEFHYEHESLIDKDTKNAVSKIVCFLLEEGDVLRAIELCQTLNCPENNLTIVLNCMGLAQSLITPNTIDENLKTILCCQRQQEIPPKRHSSVSVFALPRSTSVISWIEDDEELLNDEVTSAIELLCSVVNPEFSGYCERILVTYKISKLVNLTYDSVVKEDALSVVKLLLNQRLKSKYTLTKDFMKFSYLSYEKIAHFLSDMILSTFENGHITDKEVSVSQLIQICPAPSLLGNDLTSFVSHFNLENADSKHLTLNVELLIKAHDCHTISCNTEGICNVLLAVRKLTAALASRQEFSLLIQLILGIRRYNEMYEALDVLKSNGKLGMLMQKAERDDASLRTALLDYLKPNEAGDGEIYDLLMRNFSMHIEMAEANEKLAKVCLQSLPEKVGKGFEELLKNSIEYYQRASCEYLKNDCVKLAENCLRRAKLSALQIFLLSSKPTRYIVNCNKEEALNFAMTHKNCHHVHIVLEAYEMQREWANILFHRIILNSDFQFIEDFKVRYKLTDELITKICERKEILRSHTTKSNLMKFLISYCKENAECVLKQAARIGLHEVTTTQINDIPTTRGEGVTTEDPFAEEEKRIYYEYTIKTGKDFDDKWIDLDKSNKGLETVKHVSLSDAHRLGATIELKYNFIFYGHFISKVTITTGGFLYLSDFVHQHITRCQYMAPLMANIDTSIGEHSTVYYAYNRTVFVAEWRKVHIKDHKNSGTFHFQVVWFNDGLIYFNYKDLPLKIAKISDLKHPVTVGLSDAYYIDQILGNIIRRRIFEYHSLNVRFDDIGNRTTVEIKLLPTCIQIRDCWKCVTAKIGFDCNWCPETGYCSDGTDRFRQSYYSNGCHMRKITFCPHQKKTKKKHKKAIKTTTLEFLSALTSSIERESTITSITERESTIDISTQTNIQTKTIQREKFSTIMKTSPKLINTDETTHKSTLKTTDNNKREETTTSIDINTTSCDQEGWTPKPTPLPHGKKDKSKSSSNNSGAVVAIVIVVLVLLGLIFGVVGWVIYAYRNPSTSSGRWFKRNGTAGDKYEVRIGSAGSQSNAYAVAKRCLWKVSMFILDQQFAGQNISASSCPVNVTGKLKDFQRFSPFKGTGMFTYCPLYVKVERWQDRINELNPIVEMKPMCRSHENFNKRVSHFTIILQSSLVSLDNSLKNSLWITPVPFIASTQCIAIAVKMKSLTTTIKEDSSYHLLSLYHYKISGRVLPSWLSSTDLSKDDFTSPKRINYIWGRGGVELILSQEGKLIVSIDHFRTFQVVLFNWASLKKFHYNTSKIELFDALSLGDSLLLATNAGLYKLYMYKLPYDENIDKTISDKSYLRDISPKHLRATPLHVPSVNKINVVGFTSEKIWLKENKRWLELKRVCNESCHIIDVRILPSNSLEMLLLTRTKQKYRVVKRSLETENYIREIRSQGDFKGIAHSPFVSFNPPCYYLLGSKVISIEGINGDEKILTNEAVIDVILDRFSRVYLVTKDGRLLFKEITGNLVQFYPSIYWNKAFDNQDPIKGYTILGGLLDEDGELMLIVKGKEIMRVKVEFERISSFIYDNPYPIQFLYYFESLRKYTREVRLIIDNMNYFDNQTNSKSSLKSISSVQALNILIRHIIRDYDSSFYGSYLNRNSLNLIDEWQENMKDALTHSSPWSDSVRLENLDLSKTWSSEIPTDIHIDYGETFSFSIVVEPLLDAWAFESAHLSVRTLERSSSLEITVNRNVNWYNSSITFQISLINKRLMKSSSDTWDKNFIPVELKLLCPFKTCQKNWIKTRPMHILTVYLGCPNSLSIYFDPEMSRKELWRRLQKKAKGCWWSNDGIPCFYKNDRFYPMFTIYDWITDNKTIYQGNYTLELIGGGANYLENIRHFDNVTLERINGKNENKILRIYAEKDSIISIVLPPQNSQPITIGLSHVLVEMPNIRLVCMRNDRKLIFDSSCSSNVLPYGTLGNMMFGTLEMAKEPMLKINKINFDSNHQLMMTKLFYLPDKYKSRLYPKLCTENDDGDDIDFGRLSKTRSLPRDLPKNSRDDDDDSETDSVHSGSYHQRNSLIKRYEKSMKTSLEQECFLQNSSQFCEGSRKNLIGLALLFTLSSDEREADEFQKFFFNHITILENHTWKIVQSFEKSFQCDPKSLQTALLTSFSNFKEGFRDLLRAPRIKKPLWLSMASENDLQSYENFMDSLAFLTKTCDTKHNGFFTSCLLTAVLTRHLSWVPTVAPADAGLSETYLNKHSAKWLTTLAKSHPYNPLWAQLSDVYGAVGDPPLLTRVIVVGKRQSLVQKLITVLSYFIRCSTVREQTPSRPPVNESDTNPKMSATSKLYPDLSEFSSSATNYSKNEPVANIQKKSPPTTRLYPNPKEIMKRECLDTPHSIENRARRVEAISVGRMNEKKPVQDELSIFDEYFDGSTECDLSHVPIRPRSLEFRNPKRDDKIRPPSTASITDHLEEISLPKKPSHSPPSVEAGIASNLFAGYTNRYMSDFVIQGTSETNFTPRMIDDLIAYVKENILDEPVSEACCIVADTDNFTIKVHTCLSSMPDRVCAHEISTPSTLVSDLLYSVLQLYKLKMSSEFCAMHVEDCLQQIYFKSKILAQVVKCSGGRQLSRPELSKQIDADESDIPLLCKVASTHMSRHIET
ncbi:DgyrCDS7789 [Dimorphilus gyrociliatus]|uniref:DgyrCDS7789 n=1 Tax=Dimorphilus gyrociliatus TaxID=2664684 RepID=A0A7I8VS58_9ANNE|nr:DgyrCDS7789 [Dimorphilus gyrociliatus]